MTRRPVRTASSPTTSVWRICRKSAARMRATGARRAGTPVHGHWAKASQRPPSRWRRRDRGRPDSGSIRYTGSGGWTSRCRAWYGRYSPECTLGSCTCALHGEDSYFQPSRRRRVRLRSGLVTSRFFGANPSVRLGEIEDSLARLEANGKAVPVGPRWRDAGHVRREQARATRAASRLAGAGAPAGSGTAAGAGA